MIFLLAALTLLRRRRNERPRDQSGHRGRHADRGSRFWQYCDPTSRFRRLSNRAIHRKTFAPATD
jgi:hypothetical protein